MIKKFLFPCFLFLSFLYGCDSKTNTTSISDSKNDSIKKYLDYASNDTIAYEKRIKYNDKALKFVDLKKNDTLTRFYLNFIVYNYLSTNEWICYKKTSKIYFQKSIKTKDTLGLARCYRYKASFYRKTHVHDSSFYYYLKAEKFYKKTNDKIGLGLVYLNKSYLQYNMDDYLGSELSSKRAYHYIKNTKEYFNTYGCLVNLGNCYHNMRQYNKAIFFSKKALIFAEKNKLANRPNEYPKIEILNKIGNAYRELKKYQIAICFFKLAINEKDQLKKDSEILGYLQNNLGYCYLKTKNYNQIPFIFFKTDSLFNALGIKNEQSVSNMYLSEYYFLKNDTLKAIQYSEKAIQLAKEAKAPYYYLTALSIAGAINSKKASQYIKEYHQKNDSMLFVERSARNQYFKIQLETEEITEEKNKAINQKWIIAAIAGAVILIILLILIITQQRAKQKELRLQQEQQNANEEIYNLMLNQKVKEDEVRQTEKKRIAIELHDGIMNKLSSIRLNLSILSHKTDETTIQKCLNYINSIYQIEKDIRALSHNLNQDVFQKENSFIKMLEDFINEQNKISKTHYELELDLEIDWSSISSEIKMHLYRIIQEASQNINKYARAKKAIINLVFDYPNICMSITDDGIGFETTAVPKGIGIQNMQARVKLLNGKFTINSITHKSTTINIAIPFA